MPKEVLEIERKWIIIDGSPNLSDRPHERTELTQFYLVSKHTERVRQSIDLDSKETVYTHTIKRPGPKGGQWEKEEVISEEKAKVITFDSLDGGLLHVKVGKPDSPIEEVEREMKSLEDKIEKLFQDNNVNCLVLVTHCFVEIHLISDPKK